MNAMNATTAEWAHIEPLLDEAMSALDETDRAAVLLRYFENKSLREVGATLGRRPTGSPRLAKPARLRQAGDEEVHGTAKIAIQEIQLLRQRRQHGRRRLLGNILRPLQGEARVFEWIIRRPRTNKAPPGAKHEERREHGRNHPTSRSQRRLRLRRFRCRTNRAQD